MRAGFLVAVLLATGCATPEPDNMTGTCTIDAAPTILEQSGDPHGPDGRLLQVWDMPDTPTLWSDVSPPGGYADFVEQTTARGLETDPVPLLKAAPTSNNLLVVANAEQWIHPAGCLEKLLLGIQHARRDIFEAPTEFAAIVMRSPDRARLRIYYYTINQDGIGSASPITRPARGDADAGWTMEIVLHPHVFHPGQPELDGVIAPSIPDAHFAYNQAASGLKEAWITNGLHTVRIPAGAFGLFQRE